MNTPTRDIIVLGGSAGGIEALHQVLGSFPADLPAALFIVLHRGPGSGKPTHSSKSCAPGRR